MTRPPTKADLQARAEHWQRKYDELSDSKRDEIAMLRQEKDQAANGHMHLYNQFEEAKRLWNNWIEADKGLKTKEAYATWEPETFQELLSLLHE